MTQTPKRSWLKFGLREIVRGLLPLFPTSRELAAERDMAGRPLVDDEKFYDAHYGNSGIPKAIPLRLRNLFVAQLGKPWDRVVPTDKPEDMYPDIPFEELALEAAEEFGVQVSTGETRELDGSFDSLVRLIAAKLATLQDK